MKCPHGVNVKHKACDRCEETARAAGEVLSSVKRPESGDFLKVDLDRLPEEWNAQPELFRQHGRDWADAKRDAARAKAHKELLYAEIGEELRKSPPEEHGLVKWTEDGIKTMILTDARYKKAVGKQIDADHREDILKIDLEALRQRRDELSDQTQMALSSMFSDRPPRAAREAIEKAAFDRKGRTK